MRADVARRPPGPATPPRRSVPGGEAGAARWLYAACAGGALLALLLLIPLLVTGVPAYIHDWTWPPDAAGLRAQLLQGWEPWLDDGMGHPNPFPIALPHFVVLAFVAGFVPSRVVLAILLLVTMTGAFVAATAFARRVFGLRAAAFVCGALYVAAPLALTKLIAGHVSYLQAYAAFPLFALALREAHRSRRWTAAGALAVGVTSLQPQFLGYDLAYALIAAATGAVSPLALRNVGLLALPLLLPTLVGPTLNARGAGGVLLHQHAVIVWEKEQSAPLLDALCGLGYFTRYVDRVAIPYSLYVLGLVPILAVAAAIRLRDSRDARALLVCALVGWLLVVGLNGPLAGVEAWAFANVAPFSVFRELYNAMILFWFPACVLMAVMLQRLPVRLAITATALVAAVLVVPWTRYAGYFVPAPSAATLHAVSVLAMSDAATRKDTTVSRVVWWPALQPMGAPDRAQGGSDPLARTPLDPSSWPLYEYQPEGVFGTAVALGQLGRWDEAAHLLGWVGVRYLVTRAGIVSFASGVPRDAPPPRGAQVVRVGSVDGFTVYRLTEVRPLVTVEPRVAGSDPVATPFVPSRTDATPRPGSIVAAFPYAWKTPAVADCGAAAVISDGTTLAARGGPWILATPFDGDDHCTWRPAASLRSAGSALFVAAGSAATRTDRPALPDTPVALPQSLERSPGRWRVRIASPRAALLVARTAFDARWRARIDGRDAGTPALWNGFLSWPIAAGEHTIELRYTGAPPVWVALLVALAGLVAAAVLAALPERSVSPYRSRR